MFRDLHGTTGLPFGTFENDSCLNRFINNRSEGYAGYYGVRKSDSEDALAAKEYGSHRIYWVDYVCEITDPDGSLLFTNKDATAPALYQYLGKSGAFEELSKGTQLYDENGHQYNGPYDVRMLVLNYNLKWTDSVQVPNKNTAIKLTMAARNDVRLPRREWSKYNTFDGIATINRGACTGSMFKTGSNSNFIIENVTLDGGAEYSEGTWTDKTAVHADGHALDLFVGLRLRFPVSANGQPQPLQHSDIEN